VALDEKAVRFEHAPSRCPYCHSHCEDSEEVVACRACVARHHAECWRQLGRCSSCGGARFLGESPAAAPARPADRRILQARSVEQIDLSSIPGAQAFFRFVGLLVSVALALLGGALLLKMVEALRLAYATTPDQRSEATSVGLRGGILGIMVVSFGVYLGVRCVRGLWRRSALAPNKGEKATRLPVE
jgi:hypothetical protein